MAQDTTTFPFGKHKGVRIADLPLDYINWVLTNMDDLRPPLQAALTGELRRRETGEPAADRDRERSAQARPPVTTAPAGRPAGGQPVEAPPTNGNGSAEAKVRKIVRQEFAAMLKRVVAALEKE